MTFGAMLVALALAAAPRAPASETQAAVCALGAEMLRARPPGVKPAEAVVYDDRFQPQPLRLTGLPRVPSSLVRSWSASGPSNVFQACPELSTRLPAGARFATLDDRRRAGEEILPPGHPVTPDEGGRIEGAAQLPPLFIYTFGAPVFDHARTRALVTISYACPDLCGGLYVGEYRRVRGGWRPRGEPRMLIIS